MIPLYLCVLLELQAMATTLGLSAVALYGDPDMPMLSAADVSAGLPASTAAAALLGTSGATAMLILLFLAVTSATSAGTYSVHITFRSQQDFVRTDRGVVNSDLRHLQGVHSTSPYRPISDRLRHDRDI